MSGTSFDGVDAALIRTDGNNFIEYINSEFIPYKKKERELFNASIFKNYYKLINLINNTHLKVIKSLLIKNKKKYKKIDIIGLHGQTFFHKPEEKWSWQYINTKIFLNTFKTNIISDFRLNDINYGGEGAPLVPIYHSKLAKK